MQRHKILGAVAAVMAAGVLPAVSARADTVLYDAANFFAGQQSYVQSFTLSTPGTLTIDLASVPWLDTIQDLNCFLTTSNGVVGTPMTAGDPTMELSAGTYYAHWFGDANGQYGIGVASLKIMFQPQGAAAVPLPGTFVLLLAGLGLLFGWQRRLDNRGPVGSGSGIADKMMTNALET